MSETSMPPEPFDALNLQGLSPAEYLKAEGKLTVQQKSALASHLAARLKASSSEDFLQAEALLRLMAWNAEPPVAEAMAKAAAANPNTPRSLAWALANDDEAAAKCVLEACAALSDADLMSIVQTCENAVKMCAIARRPTVSEDVSRSLVTHGNEETVHTLLANAKAEIADEVYGTVMDRFGESERIQADIIDRPAVSAFIVQRLSFSLNPALADKLAEKFAGPAPTAAETPGYFEARSAAEWAAHLAPAIANKSLNETALVRHLSLGNFEFFARALSALSKSPYADVRAALLASPPALAAFWQRAELPTDWSPVAAAAVTALIQIDRSAGKADPQLFSRNIMDRTLANLKADKVVLTPAQQRLFARSGKR